jgi:hypothetical protein
MPMIPGNGEPWDLPNAVAESFVRYGLTRAILYDPGYPEFNNETNWNDASAKGCHDIGYVTTLPGAGVLLPGLENPTLNPEPIQPVSISPVLLPPWDPTRRVLVTGAVVSASGQFATDPVGRANQNYTQVPFEVSQILKSPHLAGKMPSGDNVAMVDGSARWRKFNDMLPRTSSVWPGLWW